MLIVIWYFLILWTKRKCVDEIGQVCHDNSNDIIYSNEKKEGMI